MNIQKIKTFFIFFVFLSVFCQSVAFSAEKHGVYKDYYSNGKVRLEMKYKKGKLIYKKTYFDNGELRRFYVYRDEKRIKEKTYYENGQLQSEWTEKSGVSKYYSKQGTLKAIVKDRPNEELIKRLPKSFL